MVFAMAISAVTAVAQSEDPANWCRGGLFASEAPEFKLGTVKGSKNEKVHFYDDSEADCPPSETCRDKAFVVPGDKLVVSRIYKGFVCSWYIPTKGLPTVGWIKLGNVDIVDAPAAPPLSAWRGDWAYADDRITFTDNKLKGNLNVTGEAYWKGLGDNVHEGGLDGRAEPIGRILKLNEADPDKHACKVTMQLIGNFLVVKDNMNCGGANVSFSGVYRKKK